MKLLKFGAVMQICRERAGFSQEQLAERLKISRSCISKLENDAKQPTAATLIQWTRETGTQEVMVAFFCGMDGLSILQNVLGLIGS